MTHPSRRLASAALALGLLPILAAPALGEVVILKDGFTLHGRVYTEMTSFDDKATGASIPTFKQNGLTICDDGARMQVFPNGARQIGAIEKNLDKFAKLEKFTRPFFPGSAFPLTGALKLRKETPFDKDWVRTLTFDDLESGGYKEVRQKLTVLTPHFMQFVSNTHSWTNCYLTREWTPKTVKALILTHPEMKPPMGAKEIDLDQRLRLARFLFQADWIDEAREELAEAEKLFPDGKAKIGGERAAIDDELADRQLQDAERARGAGRHARAQAILRPLKDRKANKAGLSVKVATMLAEYEASAKRLTSARDLLELAAGRLGEGHPAWLRPAADAILAEIHPDTAGRLDLFVQLAEEDERLRKAGSGGPNGPTQMVALAVSAWLLGKNLTSGDVAAAEKLWKTRDLVLGYQREQNEGKRETLLARFKKGGDLPAYDEVERMLPNIPPPLAAEKTPTDRPVKLVADDVPNVEKFSYWLKLPPEYTHTRSYPLLVMLQNPKDGGHDEMAKFVAQLSDKHGYVVVVPEWSRNLGTEYNYRDDERELLYGLVRKMKRTHAIDSDRVFVFGYLHGANFALDAAASRPDLFAGVVAMTPFPTWKVFAEYWRNFQLLPVYLVFGDRAGDATKTLRSMMEKWMPKGYPAFAVSYKGRGGEFFNHELPFIFDWMGRKKRSPGTPALGRFDFGSAGEEFRSLRRADNHFYWLQADEIHDRHLLREGPVAVTGAKLTGKLSEGNRLFLRTLGVSRLSVFLGRGMIEFDKKAEVFINGANGQRVTLRPRAEVLLEDLYQRADRQRPFFERLEFTLNPGS